MADNNVVVGFGGQEPDNPEVVDTEKNIKYDMSQVDKKSLADADDAVDKWMGKRKNETAKSEKKGAAKELAPIIVKTAPINIGKILLSIGAWICTYILQIPTDPDEETFLEPQEELPSEETQTGEEDDSEEEEDSGPDNS